MLTGLCGLYLQSNLLVSLLHIYILSETENLHPISLFSTSLVAQMVKLPRSYPFVVFIDCVFCLLLVCIYGLGPFIVGVLLLGSFLIDLYAF